MMKAATPLLILEAVSCGYDGAPVLERADLRIRPGELWFLLGANGAGKSTLLKTMLGLLAPCGGRIYAPYVEDRPTKVGFVPQHTTVNPSLPSTVREFVELGFIGLPAPDRVKRETVRHCLNAVGIENREMHDIRTLSGGTLRRVVLARALVRDPNLLMLDEPTNHLDPTAENGFLELLSGLHQERRLSVVFVTHDVAVASRLATHVGLIQRRRLKTGTRDEILAGEDIRSLYDDVGASHPAVSPGGKVDEENGR